MQYITRNGILTFGKFKGHKVSTVSQSWIKWAMQNIPEFTPQFDTYRNNIAENFTQAHKPARSANGKGYIASKTYNRPFAKTFTSRAKRPVNY